MPHQRRTSRETSSITTEKVRGRFIEHWTRSGWLLPHFPRSLSCNTSSAEAAPSASQRIPVVLQNFARRSSAPSLFPPASSSPAAHRRTPHPLLVAYTSSVSSPALPYPSTPHLRSTALLQAPPPLARSTLSPSCNPSTIPSGRLNDYLLTTYNDTTLFYIIQQHQHHIGRTARAPPFASRLSPARQPMAAPFALTYTAAAAELPAWQSYTESATLTTTAGFTYATLDAQGVVTFVSGEVVQTQYGTEIVQLPITVDVGYSVGAPYTTAGGDGPTVVSVLGASAAITLPEASQMLPGATAAGSDASSAETTAEVTSGAYSVGRSSRRRSPDRRALRFRLQQIHHPQQASLQLRRVPLHRLLLRRPRLRATSLPVSRRDTFRTGRRGSGANPSHRSGASSPIPSASSGLSTLSASSTGDSSTSSAPASTLSSFAPGSSTLPSSSASPSTAAASSNSSNLSGGQIAGIVVGCLAALLLLLLLLLCALRRRRLQRDASGASHEWDLAPAANSTWNSRRRSSAGTGGSRGGLWGLAGLVGISSTTTGSPSTGGDRRGSGMDEKEKGMVGGMGAVREAREDGEGFEGMAMMDERASPRSIFPTVRGRGTEYAAVGAAGAGAVAAAGMARSRSGGSGERGELLGDPFEEPGEGERDEADIAGEEEDVFGDQQQGLRTPDMRGGDWAGAAAATGLLHNVEGDWTGTPSTHAGPSPGRRSPKVYPSFRISGTSDVDSLPPRPPRRTTGPPMLSEFAWMRGRPGVLGDTASTNTSGNTGTQSSGSGTGTGSRSGGSGVGTGSSGFAAGDSRGSRGTSSMNASPNVSELFHNSMLASTLERPHAFADHGSFCSTEMARHTSPERRRREIAVKLLPRGSRRLSPPLPTRHHQLGSDAPTSAPVCRLSLDNAGESPSPPQLECRHARPDSGFLWDGAVGSRDPSRPLEGDFSRFGERREPRPVRSGVCVVSASPHQY